MFYVRLYQRLSNDMDSRVRHALFLAQLREKRLCGFDVNLALDL